VLKIQNFEYNGFFGKLLEGLTPYTATFKEWTSDPGIGIFTCSDGEERLIPTFAIISKMPEDIPKQEKSGVLFGAACKS
jgi:hypothetical protein